LIVIWIYLIRHVTYQCQLRHFTAFTNSLLRPDGIAKCHLRIAHSFMNTVTFNMYWGNWLCKLLSSFCSSSKFI